MGTLNDKFLKVTGLTWDLEKAIQEMQDAEMTQEEINEKILWLIPDGAMLDHPGRKADATRELLEELGIDPDTTKFSTAEVEYDDEVDDDEGSTANTDGSF